MDILKFMFDNPILFFFTVVISWWLISAAGMQLAMLFPEKSFMRGLLGRTGIILWFLFILMIVIHAK